MKSSRNSPLRLDWLPDLIQLEVFWIPTGSATKRLLPIWDESLAGACSIPLIAAMEPTKVIIQDWQRHYNEIRPHSSLNYRTPAEFIAGLKSDLSTETRESS